MTTLDFDPETVPWTDRPDFEEELESRQRGGRVDAVEAAMLRRWSRDGYVRFQGLVPDAQIDPLLNDVERAWDERPKIDLDIEGRGVIELAVAPPREQIGHHRYRLLDLQDVYESPRNILFAPKLVRFLRLLLDDTPVAMQSLFFEYPSEAETHQDFPFVQAQIPSHLVGCWIACEKVDENNGPLAYYPRSHRLPKFDWGDGSMVLAGHDDQLVARFTSYLETGCAEAGLERRVLKAEKGDALLWHGALAHGGAPARDGSATRKTFVVHYSSHSAYPRDRRTPRLLPHALESNGAMVYLRRRPALLARLRSKLGAIVRGDRSFSVWR